jgi:O-antigen/teichoic acid export membrane protein
LAGHRDLVDGWLVMRDFSPVEYGLLALLSCMGTGIALKEATTGAGWAALVLTVYGALVTVYCLWRWRRVPRKERPNA